MYLWLYQKVVISEVEFAAVTVVCAELAETLRRHAEDEVIREDGVVVLDDRGDLSLGLVVHIHVDGLVFEDFRGREELVELGQAEEARDGADGQRGADLLDRKSVV